jgi:hypothetical protein
MLSKNIYFKSKPNFRPPSPTKASRDIAWVAPIIGCPEKFDLPAEWWPNLGLATTALALQRFAAHLRAAATVFIEVLYLKSPRRIRSAK